METIEIDVPFEYAVHARRSRQRAATRWLVRDAVRVAIPSIDFAEVDRIQPILNIRWDQHDPDHRAMVRLSPAALVARLDRQDNPWAHAQTAIRELRVAWQGKLWSPVRTRTIAADVPGWRNRTFEMSRQGPAGLANLVRRRFSGMLESASPVSIPDLGHGETTYGRVSSTWEADPSRLSVESGEREAGLRTAQLDAQDLAVIGGILYSSRWEPIYGIADRVGGYDRPHHAIAENAAGPSVDTRSVPASVEDAASYAEAMGVPAPAPRELVPWGDMPDALEGWRPRYRSFEMATRQAAVELLRDVMPNRAHVALIGSGVMGRCDLPNEILDAAFDVRDLLRAMPRDLRLVDRARDKADCLDLLRSCEVLHGLLDDRIARPEQKVSAVAGMSLCVPALARVRDLVEMPAMDRDAHDDATALGLTL